MVLGCEDHVFCSRRAENLRPTLGVKELSAEVLREIRIREVGSIVRLHVHPHLRVWRLSLPVPPKPFAPSLLDQCYNRSREVLRHLFNAKVLLGAVVAFEAHRAYSALKSALTSGLNASLEVYAYGTSGASQGRTLALFTDLNLI